MHGTVCRERSVPCTPSNRPGRPSAQHAAVQRPVLASVLAARPQPLHAGSPLNAMRAARHDTVAPLAGRTSRHARRKSPRRSNQNEKSGTCMGASFARSIDGAIAIDGFSYRTANGHVARLPFGPRSNGRTQRGLMAASELLRPAPDGNRMVPPRPSMSRLVAVSFAHPSRWPLW
ncbi:hypothetical protein T440DRAFT_136265 [Plenodomus tracheiphilus IPT5]|uniref:Uncharacterized protein n=1 Tax=Plenodomus tracheiphilus IPT5 TaxID=1408161 RepID=A0A6A7B1L0_9PLEO|nr:hypothetical protein T440DRAFT_136265 [Plenodomus tracheiphilus IPT5]